MALGVPLRFTSDPRPDDHGECERSYAPTGVQRPIQRSHNTMSERKVVTQL